MAPLPAGPGLPAPAQPVLYHRDPLGVLLRARARYGPVFSLSPCPERMVVRGMVLVPHRAAVVRAG